MKPLFIFIILLFAFVANVFSQSYHKSKNPLQSRFDSLRIVNRNYYLKGKIDSMPTSNALLLQLAAKLHNDSSISRSYGAVANYFWSKGDYSRALEYDVKAMEAADHGYTPASATFRGNIANIYIALGDYDVALRHLHNAEKYLVYDTVLSRAFIPTTLASAYIELKKPDSALKYVQLAFRVNTDLARKNIKDPVVKNTITAGMGSIYGTFARVYDLLHKPEQVNYYYRKAIRYGDSLNLQGITTRTSIRYGRYLSGQQKYDEAKNYGIQGINTALKDHFKDIVVDASGLLYNLYDRENNRDSAYYYLKIKNLYQDSISAEQKANQLQGLIMNQHLKEVEQQAKAEQDAEQRHRNIVYAIIALGLVIFIIFFLLLTRSIVVNPRMIETVGVVGLLIMFEFINLVIHPYLAEFTNESPLPMLLILVAIAAVIVPLHHRLEHWIKHRLVEKNQMIRLAKTTRTINS
jgi:hypothetical protein